MCRVPTSISHSFVSSIVPFFRLLSVTYNIIIIAKMCNFILVLELTLIHSYLAEENSVNEALSVTQFVFPRSTRYQNLSLLAAGAVWNEVCPMLLNMTRCGSQTQSVMILSLCSLIVQYRGFLPHCKCSLLCTMNSLFAQCILLLYTLHGHLCGLHLVLLNTVVYVFIVATPA